MSRSPVIQPIPFRDAAAAFAPFADQPMAVLLDSALPGNQSRFSYIAIDPFSVIRCAGYPWAVTVDGVRRTTDAFETVRQELAKYALSAMGPTPFTGGAVGFFAYELGGVLEHMLPPKAGPETPDMVIGLYDTIAAFDLEQRAAWVIAHDIPGRAPAAARAAQLAAGLGSVPVGAREPILQGVWRAESSRAEQEKRIAAAVAAIHAGDIYQANITQRFVTDPPATTPFDLYLRLRAATPAPFAAFMNADDGLHILSASPERFLKVTAEGQIESRPIKGTRPRASDAVRDRALADELTASAKDRAENLMIVDLLRNDLARVCVQGSVEVPVLCGLESFPVVHHLVSVVTGQLRSDATAMDLLRAAFPGGSITGAPKIKAMEIIRDLELSPRGPYCGTIAWMGFDGAMDSSIVIRTLVWDQNTLSVQAGGGIVAESNPAQEYDESVLKAQALLNLVGT